MFRFSKRAPRRAYGLTNSQVYKSVPGLYKYSKTVRSPAQKLLASLFSKKGKSSRRVSMLSSRRRGGGKRKRGQRTGKRRSVRFPKAAKIAMMLAPKEHMTMALSRLLTSYTGYKSIGCLDFDTTNSLGQGTNVKDISPFSESVLEKLNQLLPNPGSTVAGIGAVSQKTFVTNWKVRYEARNFSVNYVNLKIHRCVLRRDFVRATPSISAGNVYNGAFVDLNQLYQMLYLNSTTVPASSNETWTRESKLLNVAGIGKYIKVLKTKTYRIAPGNHVSWTSTVNPHTVNQWDYGRSGMSGTGGKKIVYFFELCGDVVHETEEDPNQPPTIADYRLINHAPAKVGIIANWNITYVNVNEKVSVINDYPLPNLPSRPGAVDINNPTITLADANI